VGAKRQRQTRDLRVWKEYIQSYKVWKIKISFFANEQAWNGLRGFLRTSCVDVNANPRVNVQNALMNVLDETKPHNWTITEIEEVMEEFPQQFSSRHNPYLDKSDQRSHTYFSPKLQQESNQYQD
ncbi:hypothetical protein OnM2_103033, partial [Erysiphe neolycopersici]